ncbi:MAG: hypothetical protein ABSH20_12660, partial [Tepidisphaeraceae bacterium]
LVSTVGGAIGTVSGSGATYTVPVTGVSGTGTIGLNLVNNNSIKDLATNTLAGTTFTGQTCTVDTVPPTVVSINRIGSGDTAVISFSEPITGLVLADLTLQRDNATVPLTGTTLANSGNNNWSLSGLSAITSAVGQYTLTLAPTGIADLVGNALVAGRSTSWLNSTLTDSVSSDSITISRNNTSITITSNSIPAYTTPIADFASTPLVVGVAAASTLTLDFSSGSPVPTAGLTYQALAGGGDSLRITGTSAANALTVNPSQVLVDSSTITCSSVASLTLASPGAVIPLASLTIGPSAQLGLAAGKKLFQIGGLAIGNGASLDMADNDMVLAYSASSTVANVRQLLFNGIIGTTPSIFSSVSVVSGHPTGMAMVDNQTLHLSQWSNVPIATGNNFQQVILKFTYRGDNNLDGKVTAADYLNIVGSFGQSGTGYFGGDLDYDNLVTASDLALVSQNLGAGDTSGAPMLSAAADPAAMSAAIKTAPAAITAAGKPVAHPAKPATVHKQPKPKAKAKPQLHRK